MRNISKLFTKKEKGQCSNLHSKSTKTEKVSLQSSIHEGEGNEIKLKARLESLKNILKVVE